jgi:hypothetical protein
MENNKHYCIALGLLKLRGLAMLDYPLRSKQLKRFYCCIVYSEDLLIIKNQPMHYYILCLF